MRKTILIVICLLAMQAGPGWAASVSACAEPSSGPPWLYAVKSAAGQRTGELAGFTPDIIHRAFARMGMELTIRGDMPLIRCMEMVASHQIDFAIGVYRDPQRERQFAYSAPYKVLTPQIFFSASHPIVVRTVTDLAKYRGCGRHGWSYLHYGLKDADLDKGANSYSSMVMKLKSGRCDYFPEELEVMATQILGKDSFMNDPELRHTAVLGAEAPSKHMVAAKGSEAARLLPRFNAALAAMIKSGEFKELWKKNAGDVPF